MLVKLFINGEEEVNVDTYLILNTVLELAMEFTKIPP
jgi:hypothetical protein